MNHFSNGDANSGEVPANEVVCTNGVIDISSQTFGDGNPINNINGLREQYKQAVLEHIQNGNGTEMKKLFIDFLDGDSMGSKGKDDRVVSSKKVVSNMENAIEECYTELVSLEERDTSFLDNLHCLYLLQLKNNYPISKENIKEEIALHVQYQTSLKRKFNASIASEKKQREEVQNQLEELKKELESKKRTNKPTILENPLPGYPRKINVPHILTKPITVQFIKENSNHRDDIARKILYPVMKHIVFPKTIKALRKPLIWRTISMRILNYFISLIILVKYQGDPEMPTSLIYTDGIPPWWFVCHFFRHFQFKIAKSENCSKNKPKEAAINPKKKPVQAAFQPSEFQKKLQKEYIGIHQLFFACQKYCKNAEECEEMFPLIYMPSCEKEDAEQSTDKEEAEPMVEEKDSSCQTMENLDLEILECHLDGDSKRPIAFNNVCKFISWYNKRRKYGAYDEYSQCPSTPPAKDTIAETKLPSYIAHNGLHHLEFQIMEVVLNAQPNVTMTIINN